MSHSAVFKVNIFTAPLITRASGMALPTPPTPSYRKIKYSYALPSFLSLPLVSPLRDVFNPHIVSFLVLSLPLPLTSPLTFHISSSHTLHTSVRVCVSCMGHISHVVNASCGSDMHRLFPHVYVSGLLAKVLKGHFSTWYDDKTKQMHRKWSWKNNTEVKHAEWLLHISHTHLSLTLHGPLKKTWTCILLWIKP